MIEKTVKDDLNRIDKSVKLDQFENKRVLISGGAGFLGSWICDVLARRASNLLCLDNLSTGLPKNISHLKGEKGFEFQNADVCNYETAERFDYIFHLASRPSPEDYQRHPVETAIANSNGTQRMLELARKSDSSVFFASSSEVYGDAEVFPTPESYEGIVDPLGPRSSYEEGKRFGEAICKAYHDQYGLDIRIGRIFNSYGPRLRAEGLYGRVISRFMLQALRQEPLTVYGDGSQTRSFCYVMDTIVGILSLAQSRHPEYVFNLGSGAETRILDLAKQIISVSCSKSNLKFLPFPPGDHVRRLPEISKARAELFWSPTIMLEEGLSRTLTWLQAEISMAPKSPGGA